VSIPDLSGDGQYFFDMDECARMNCDKTAVALLTFSPPEAKAWLYDLDQPDPTGGIMLCRRHANATVVPMSWQLVDARDPAWPGPAGSQPAAQAMAAASAEELVASLDLPSDTAALDQDFVTLTEDLPVPTQRYAEVEMATASRAAVAADPSLFELPLSDIPSVTPYPS
jgi:hypothetical protein